jgi:nitrite reductase/ring-hydroxylating ferredoxin subunit/uncharacterized membrane protein
MLEEEVAVISNYVHDIIHQVPQLEAYGKQIKRITHQAVLNGGESARDAMNVLHGTWLGHPFHPVLTDISIGAWSLAAVLDVVGAGSSSEDVGRTADTLTAMGTVSALPTVLTGLADFSTIPNRAVAVGTLHGLMNTAALVFYGLSVRARRQGDRGLGVTFAMLGLGTLTAGAWLGGDLVYSHRVGVDHTKRPSEPKTWTPVLDESELAAGEPRRVDAAGTPVLLYRAGDSIYAVGAVCSHAGGPLEEGEFYNTCVQCPWHDSVFDLRDGSIVHGPATYSLPDYEARIADGKVEVRLTRA